MVQDPRSRIPVSHINESVIRQPVADIKRGRLRQGFIAVFQRRHGRNDKHIFQPETFGDHIFHFHMGIVFHDPELDDPGLTCFLEQPDHPQPGDTDLVRDLLLGQVVDIVIPGDL